MIRLRYVFDLILNPGNNVWLISDDQHVNVIDNPLKLSSKVIGTRTRFFLPDTEEVEVVWEQESDGWTNIEILSVIL